jgi:hypothetical protein
MFSSHHFGSMYERGSNPKFHESSFKNDQSSGIKAEKTSKSSVSILIKGN